MVVGYTQVQIQERLGYSERMASQRAEQTGILSPQF